MKLHRLEMTGFGPFRETQVIDFDAFDREGVFLISGRTGAGKSSILDGVSFALYGSVPRYDGGDKRLRSDHCFLGDPTEVRLEFTVGGTRWRVTRAPEYDRPAQRGGGLTPEKARAEVEELVAGTWVGRAARLRDAGELLSEILGVNAQQFQQVILLAQNKFSRFLLAGNNERQHLLRTLFGTQRFEKYRDDLEQRRRAAQAELDEGGTTARTLLDVAERHVAANGIGSDDDAGETADLDTRRAAVAVAVQRADYRVEARGHERAAADAAATAAAAVYRDLVARAERLTELAAARAELDRLDAETADVTADRARLELARAAAVLQPVMDAADRATAAEAAATIDLEAARAAWQADGDDDDLDRVIDELTAAISRADAALAVERELQTRTESHARRIIDLTDAEAALGAIETAAAALPERRSAVEAALVTARAGSARLADAQAAHARAVAAVAASGEVESLTAVAAEADATHLRAADADQAAATALAELLRRRLDGYAGELAAALVDGEACAVCGSTAHPAPAVHTGEPVTDDALADAEVARDAAASATRTAAETARTARERLAAGLARSGGRTIEQARDDLAAAEAAVDTALAAQTDAQRHTDELAQLDALAADARSEAAALRDRIASLREAQAVDAAAIATAQAAVDDARGEQPTVAARLADDTARRDVARALRTARQAHAERASAAAEAATLLGERLADSTFATVDDARAAALGASEQHAIEARVTEHAAALAAAKGRALDLELQTAGDRIDPEAVTTAADAAAAAEAARSAAIAALADATTAATTLRHHLDRVDAALAAMAGRAAAAATVARLADTVAGREPNTRKMDLETFVLAAELEEIVAAANVRLAEMSSGRFTLHHSDARQARGAASGLGIDVLDAHTGKLRSPQSLSGGETFLASLALALGLAEVVTSRAGGIRLDTLFVDEGFGSLDPETLELAMRTLDELRAGGRVVGVISHVEAMKEQIPAQLVVEASPDGPSRILQDAAVAS
ncbi:AAA family ATPase [Microbacterium dauci]|uniref:Nuclease SbcCD subunit C n=1 Tax=Microbacterium dauci TaxID=3048008 RepID=A0ABT6ZEU9_9MICO|nr:SMC family ATPase [Microbacterium sp. LX3-4]MDJ1114684.1 SMC family ATPase [Microbacterium sp. LX3-4]